MVVADEAKIQQEPNACYRWSERGETPVIAVKRDQRKNVSIYGGLSLKLKRVFAHFCPWQHSVATIEWLETIKTYWLTQTASAIRKKILIVWDNASWHRSKTVRQWLTDNPGVVELINLPPYSPELNPQEHVWKALKQYLATLSIDEQKDFVVIRQKAEQFLKNTTFNYKFL